jgi:hypothetical protein
MTLNRIKVVFTQTQQTQIALDNVTVAHWKIDCAQYIRLLSCYASPLPIVKLPAPNHLNAQ